MQVTLDPVPPRDLPMGHNPFGRRRQSEVVVTASGSMTMMADAPDRLVSCSDGDERERIIVAAEQVVARDGICGLGVRAVCQRAGLSTHRFYDHFESKRDLLAAMLGIQLRTAAEVLTLTAHDRLTPIERIWRYLDCALDMAIDRLATAPTSIYARHWRVLMPYHQEMLEEGIFAMTRPLVAALADGHAHGVLYSPDPENDARVVYFLLSGMVYDRPCPAVMNPREEFERCIVPFIARSMGVPLPAGFSTSQKVTPEAMVNTCGRARRGGRSATRSVSIDGAGAVNH